MVRRARSIHGLRSVTNRAIAACDMREGCGDDDLRVRRFDAQVHVFDGFTHDGHRHSSDLRGFFG